MRYEATASDAELIDLVVTPLDPVGPFVGHQLEGLLIVRGPAAVVAIAEAMAARPLDRSTRRLAGVLVEIQHRHPQETEHVAGILVATLRQALELGANSWAVGELLGWLGRVVGSGADDPDTTAVAERILTLTRAEADPYLLAIDRARAILGVAETKDDQR